MKNMKTVKERPILFSAPMVRAILDGTKTQTRRIVKSEIVLDWLDAAKFNPEFVAHPENDMCAHGKIGDLLWVRETWRGWVRINPLNESPKYGVARYVPAKLECNKLDYKATSQEDDEPYRPSIHMPRWASRINLEITNIRVERLQDISEEDAKAEGVILSVDGLFNHREEFYSLWQSINGPESWDSNPWVWVIEFKRLL